MRLRDRRRPFGRQVGSSRRRIARRLGLRERRNERAVLVSNCISLTATLLLAGMLVYALFKFFQMVRLRGLELWPLGFVPVAIVIVLLVLLRVARSLIREIAARSRSE